MTIGTQVKKKKSYSAFTCSKKIPSIIPHQTTTKKDTVEDHQTCFQLQAGQALDRRQ